MVYNADNTYKMGRKVVRVIDANGFDHPVRDMVSVDTDQGLIEKLDRDDKGHYVLNLSGNAIERKYERVPTPVTVFFEDIKRDSEDGNKN